MSLSHYIKAHCFHSTTALYELAWQKHLYGARGKTQGCLNVAINVIEVKQLNCCADLLITRSEKRASELDIKIRKCQRFLNHLKSIRDNPVDSVTALENMIIRRTPIFSSHYQLRNCEPVRNAALEKYFQPEKTIG